MKKEIEKIIENAINDFQNDWCGHDEYNEGVKNYSEKIFQLFESKVSELENDYKEEAQLHNKKIKKNVDLQHQLSDVKKQRSELLKVCKTAYSLCNRLTMPTEFEISALQVDLEQAIKNSKK